ncbi:growth/differentiation factor 8-like [Dermatophagoides pteronyssinus]|uniref:growth/differentiation factor 8-like n=1 Tax=Dermatophagoides pteronyssinus TaxID=6956 RepID=UPI003F67B4B7
MDKIQLNSSSSSSTSSTSSSTLLSNDQINDLKQKCNHRHHHHNNSTIKIQNLLHHHQNHNNLNYLKQYHNSSLMTSVSIITNLLFWLFITTTIIISFVNANNNQIDKQSSSINISSSSLLMKNRLLLADSLLAEQNLNDAIKKLTIVWDLVHNNDNNNNNNLNFSNNNFNNQFLNLSMISLSLQSSKLQQQEQKTVSHNRSRRSTLSKQNDDDNQMLSDDSSIYSGLSSTENITTSASTMMKNNKQQSKILRLNRNCTTCLNDEQTRQLRIESIKLNILNKLNMERAPNVSIRSLPKIPPINSMLNHLSQMMNDQSSSPSTLNDLNDSPKIMSKILDLNDYFGPINHQNDDNQDEQEFISAEKSIVFAQQKPPFDRIVDQELRSQYFKFPSNIYHQHVQKAFLWIYLKGSSQLKTSSRIVIYQVVRNKQTPLLMIKSKRISNSTTRKGGWIHLRMEKLLTKWFENPDTNFGIVIHAFDNNGQQLNVIHSDDVEQDSPLRPFMEISVDRKNPLQSSLRRKRTIGLNCEDKSSEIRCCRYPLTVDFEQFGWDWIIAPKRYQANYCSGECPFVLMNQYPHTHLIQQINLNAIGPCCSPRKMSSISMLYLDSDLNVIYGILPNMVVERCGCS